MGFGTETTLSGPSKATLSSVYMKQNCPPWIFISQCLVILPPLVFVQSFDHYGLSLWVISSYHELPQVGQSYMQALVVLWTFCFCSAIKVSARVQSANFRKLVISRHSDKAFQELYLKNFHKKNIISVQLENLQSILGNSATYRFFTNLYLQMSD